MDGLMTAFSGQPVIDIIKLDKWAQRNDGYVEDGKTSLNDHIQLKYGDAAINFLNRMMQPDGEDSAANNPNQMLLPFAEASQP